MLLLQRCYTTSMFEKWDLIRQVRENESANTTMKSETHTYNNLKIYTSILKLVMILSAWYYTSVHVPGNIWYYLLYSIDVWDKVKGVNTSPLHFIYMSWLTIEFHIIRSYHHMHRRRKYFNNHLLRLVSIKSQQVWWHAPFIDSRINMEDNISKTMHYQPILNFNLTWSDVPLERGCWD